MNEALIVLGDQLFPVSFYSPYRDKLVFMAEDRGLCTHYRYHKHKLIFFLTSMRRFRDELKEAGFRVHYDVLSEETYIERLEKFIQKNKIKKIFVGEIQDKFFEKMLIDCFKNNKVECEIIETPMFLCSRQDFKNYLFYHPKPFMKNFYEGERKRIKILLDDKKRPLGGEWSYDSENRKKTPKILNNVDLPGIRNNPELDKVKDLVEKEFSHHPGMVDNFWLPTNRTESLEILNHFIKHHLKDFGQYQDAITNRTPFMFHSVISPMLNAGLITPQETIDKVIKAMQKDTDIPLSSVEGFVRQVMGWREFVRGIYQNYSETQENKNFFQHTRKLKNCWYEGTTGLPPVDDAIKKAVDFGYCHHIERLMILSNVMLLSEIHPHEVHKWFMELFVDSADWVMGPNVYGMGQFSDGGIFATKPYISGSNYILKMSDYKKGPWCDIWDGLFWRFIDRNRDFLKKNHRLNMMVVQCDKMDPKRKLNLMDLAQQFIENTTN